MENERLDPSITSAPANHFSWIRTRLSIERTLGAWMRTAVSLIGFGFTIFNFFQHLSSVPGMDQARRPKLPELLSLGLVVAGTLGLLLEIIEYRGMIRYLARPELRDIALRDPQRWTPTAGTAILLCLIGAFALVMMLTRMT